MMFYKLSVRSSQMDKIFIYCTYLTKIILGIF